MSAEYLKQTQLPHEVQVIRKWLAEEIVGRGICPPLSKLFQRCRDAEGQPDWNTLSTEIDIETFKDVKPQNPFLIEKVTASYVRYMFACIDGGGPKSKVIILPEFVTNAQYDEFITQVKLRAFDILKSTSENLEMVRKGFRLSPKTTPMTEAEIERVVNPTNEVGMIRLMAQMVEGSFNPVYFYGKKVSDADVAEMTGRGPTDRQKYLSRAPFFMMQVVNSIEDDLTGNLDKSKLYERNTCIANEQLPTLEQKMKSYRRGD